MGVILVVVGVIGILVSLLNLYSGARYLAVQTLFSPLREARVMPQTIWQLNTVPALSTVLLFALEHWVFAFLVLLSAFYVLLSSLLAGREGLAQDWLGLLLLGIGVIGWVEITFGAPILITLFLTGRASGAPTILCWHLPVLVVAFFFLGRFVTMFLYGVMAALASALVRSAR